MQACNHVDPGMTKQTFPVLFLDDLVVLPDMVVPLELTDQAQGVARRRPRRPIETRTSRSACSSSPGSTASTGSMGTVAEVTQIGRMPSGEPAVVLRGDRRARIGTGVPGPGAALWVEAETARRAAPLTDRGPRAGHRVQADPDLASSSSARPGR